MDDITHRNIYQSQFNPTSSSPLTLNGLSINLPESFPGPPLLRRALNPGISPWWGTPRGLFTSACVMIPDCGETPGWVSSRRHLDSLWPGFLLYTKMIPDPFRTNLVPLARRSLERRQSAGVTMYKNYLHLFRVVVGLCSVPKGVFGLFNVARGVAGLCSVARGVAGLCSDARGVAGLCSDFRGVAGL